MTSTTCARTCVETRRLPRCDPSGHTRPRAFRTLTTPAATVARGQWSRGATDVHWYWSVLFWTAEGSANGHAVSRLEHADPLGSPTVNWRAASGGLPRLYSCNRAGYEDAQHAARTTELPCDSAGRLSRVLKPGSRGHGWCTEGGDGKGSHRARLRRGARWLAWNRDSGRDGPSLLATQRSWNGGTACGCGLDGR